MDEVRLRGHWHQVKTSVRSGRSRPAAQAIVVINRLAFADYFCEAATGVPSARHIKKLVAGARFELYSAYPIQVPAVPASVIATG